MLRGWSRTRIAIAIAVVSCGGAFTTAPDDGGHATNMDGSIDAPIADVATEDVRVRRDGAVRDAASEDVTTVDSSPEPRDGSPVDHDGGPTQDAEPEVGSEASSCSHPCPSGFECLATKCVDRAAPHFSATMAQLLGNWSYGYETSLGGMFMTYTHPWKAGVAIDVWTDVVTSTLEPSVFHNSGLVTETYGGMTLTAGLLGLFPGAASEASVVRWTAPIAGNYTIAATFTGISTPPTLASVGFFIKGASIFGSSKPLNMYGGVNFFVFPGASQGEAGAGPVLALLAGDAVDFYADPYMNSDDSRGGVELVATITAN
jgi:hypothetical protein